MSTKLLGLLTLIHLFISGCKKESPVEDSKKNNPVGYIESQIVQWFNNQQLSNGLLESIEDGNVVSLYDNALAALVFISHNNFSKAEKIFDFFNARIDSELKAGLGGFSQLRDRSGKPNNHRWMGDNAWLLIALNNYKEKTNNHQYDRLASEIADWLIKLQDIDGGLFAGYGADGKRLDYKVTEGMIDSYNAVEGYTEFHSKLLNFLKQNRWSKEDNNLVAWPENPPYLYALDLHSWSYLIFNHYPSTSLITADRHLTTQNSTLTGKAVNGYCFDEDRDVVWFEGTGQMALGFHFANMHAEKGKYLSEMEKGMIQSKQDSNGAGFPYASNPGTHYGDGQLWETADTEIAISGGAWYIFTKREYNPFAIGRKKNVPQGDMFWLD